VEQSSVKFTFCLIRKTFLPWWDIVITTMKEDTSQNDFEAMKDMLERSGTLYVVRNEGGRLQIEISTGSCHDATIMCTFRQGGKFVGIYSRY